jgi:hypothetical protein
MAHYHYCAVCRIPVANCADESCQQENSEHANAGEHYCSIHHPDPEYHVAVTPPLKRS